VAIHFEEDPGSDPVFDGLGKLLPERREVDPRQLRWSDGDVEGSGTFVDAFIDRSQLMYLAVSVDLRRGHLGLVAELALIANRNGWLAVTSGGRFFRPSVRRFLQEIQGSPAMRWVRRAMAVNVRRNLLAANEETSLESLPG